MADECIMISLQQTQAKLRDGSSFFDFLEHNLAQHFISLQYLFLFVDLLDCRKSNYFTRNKHENNHKPESQVCWVSSTQASIKQFFWRIWRLSALATSEIASGQSDLYASGLMALGQREVWQTWLKKRKSFRTHDWWLCKLFEGPDWADIVLLWLW